MNLITNLLKALKNPSETRFLKLKISGEIPLELAQLNSLEELYLEGNFTTFTMDACLLPSLRLLSLNSPHLKTFPSEVLKCPQLKNLKILAGLFEQLFLPLEVLSPLQSLTIKQSKLKSLPQEIAQIQSLQEMNLSQNCLSSLPASLVDLGQLKRLNIDKNKFSLFPEVIKNCKNLKYLSCDGNLFSDEEKERIQREFNLTPY